MKRIFLCQDCDNINNVYSDQTIEKLGIKKEVFCKKDLLENPDKFKDTEIIFSTWGMPSFSREEIKETLPSLKAVFYAAGTVQAFARPFLEEGVKVFSAWAANAVPVAEYTVAQIILANKGFFKTSRMASGGEYKKARETFSNYKGNFNRKVGIIGAGMIGKLVIKMLKDYKLDVLVFDPFLSEDAAKELKVTKTSLEELFEKCSVISNHLANNAQTQGMIKGEHFAKMMPYATFINTGRGAQIVENEMCKVLREREDLIAVLDVTHPEPPLENSPLYELDNIIITPHIAGSCGYETFRMSEFMAAEYEAFEKGEKTNYQVSLKMLETMA